MCGVRFLVAIVGWALAAVVAWSLSRCATASVVSFLVVPRGVTAADLWLVDRLLWVEGPSEQRVFEILVADRLAEADRSTLAVRRMPDASRFAAKSRRQADAAYRFCGEVARAIAPLAVRMLFVFDADEKSAEFRDQIHTASGERSTFLPVRELENMFLDSALLQPVLATLCQQAERAAPDLEAVTAGLAELLNAHDDHDLYPHGPPEAGSERTVVRGSRVIGRLWWKLAVADYEKVRDGERLARAALQGGGQHLQPLIEILDRLDPTESAA